MSERQREVYGFILKFWREWGVFPTYREISGHFKISLKAVQDHIKALEQKGYLRREKGKSRNIRVDLREFIGIPVLGIISAGKGLLAFEDLSKDLPFDPFFFSRSGNVAALRVVGDSMIGDHIKDGDIAIVDLNKREPNREDIFLLRIRGEETTIKRIKIQGQKIHLIPSNLEFSVEIFPLEEVEILGTLVGIIRRNEKI